MVKLDIPYRSQWDSDAGDHSADCGPTCLAMVLNYRDVDISPDSVYDHIPDKGQFDFTNFTELMDAGSAEKVPFRYHNFDDQIDNQVKNDIWAENLGQSVQVP